MNWARSWAFSLLTAVPISSCSRTYCLITGKGWSTETRRLGRTLAANKSQSRELMGLSLLAAIPNQGVAVKCRFDPTLHNQGLVLRGFSS